jgi:hypothetical protein
MGNVTADRARVHRPRAIEVPPGGSRCQEHNARQGGSKSGDAQRVTERSNRTTLFHLQRNIIALTKPSGVTLS